MVFILHVRRGRDLVETAGGGGGGVCVVEAGGWCLCKMEGGGAKPETMRS